ncbi:hypothetical protein AB0E59_11560 [Lentzea sp. NPDC034063]
MNGMKYNQRIGEVSGSKSLLASEKDQKACWLAGSSNPLMSLRVG